MWGNTSPTPPVGSAPRGGVLNPKRATPLNKSERAVSAMSDDEFDSRFPDEKAAVDWFIYTRYKGNLVCPHCGKTANIYRERKRLKVFHCSICNNLFSPIKGTIFEKTHIKIIKWFRTIKNFLNDRAGYSACHVVRDLKITYKSAWRMMQQIRIAMANKEIEHIFDAFIEVDETYIGGKPRKPNNREGKELKTKIPKNKRGRGTKKIPVVGVKERSTGRVVAKVMLPNSKGKTLSGKQLVEVIERACKEKPAEKIIVATDELSSYNKLDSKKYKNKYIHVKVNHKIDQYDAENGIDTNGIENFLSVIKNGIRGVYHHISLKYLQRYVEEYSFKQNTRTNISMFNILLGQCVLV
jgi:ribosomal protein L37AE/L43A